MKKFFTFLFLLATVVAYAQFPHTLPINHTTFFATSAIKADGVTLEKAAYASTTQDATNPVMVNQWSLSGKTSEATTDSKSPVVSKENFLSYSTYIDNMSGPKVTVPGLVTSSTMRTTVFSLTSGDEYTDAAFYVSFLANFSAAPTTANDFFCFDSNYTGNAQRGRLFVKNDPDNNGVQIGIGWSSAATTYSPTLALNVTHLIVVKMVPTAAGTTETCALWINPVIGQTEAQATASLVEKMDQPAALKKIRGIVVRQRPNIALEYAGFRFSNKWEDVVKKSGSTSVNKLDGDNSNFKVYPTTVSDNVNFAYNLSQSANCKLDIYNTAGQLVKTLLDSKNLPAGNYSKSYNVSDLNTGLYFVRFTSGNTSESRKMIISK